MRFVFGIEDYLASLVFVEDEIDFRTFVVSSVEDALSNLQRCIRQLKP